MTGIRVHHLSCAHLRRLSLGGLPLACHVLLVETPTNWRQRAANQGRLRRLTAEHPEIDVFCAHDPAPLAGRPTARAVG